MDEGKGNRSETEMCKRRGDVTRRRSLRLISKDTMSVLHTCRQLNPRSTSGCTTKHNMFCAYKRSRHSRDSRCNVITRCNNFNDLPPECKLLIFKNLMIRDRGIAAQVCKDWHGLIRSSSMWCDVDLTQFGSSQFPDKYHICGNDETEFHNRYKAYSKKVVKFVDYLKTGPKPHLKSVQAVFDIGFVCEPWFKLLKRLIVTNKCGKLTYVKIDWTTTVERPHCIDRFCCLFNKAHRCFQRHENRRHNFHRFLELLSERVPHLKRVDVPFDWCRLSLRFLCRLKSLEEVHLRHYFMFAQFQQWWLNHMCKCLSSLTKLSITFCVLSYKNTDMYEINHQNLTQLDLSGCKGFFLKYVNLPKLERFSFTREPWTGDLVSPNVIPCLYEVLQRGAPALRCINDVQLPTNWATVMTPDLEVLMATACPCSMHAADW